MPSVPVYGAERRKGGHHLDKVTRQHQYLSYHSVWRSPPCCLRIPRVPLQPHPQPLGTSGTCAQMTPPWCGGPQPPSWGSLPRCWSWTMSRVRSSPCSPTWPLMSRWVHSPDPSTMPFLLWTLKLKGICRAQQGLCCPPTTSLFSPGLGAAAGGGGMCEHCSATASGGSGGLGDAHSASGC